MRDLIFLTREDQYEIQRVILHDENLERFNLTPLGKHLIYNCLIRKVYYRHIAKDLSISNESAKRIYLATVSHVADCLNMTPKNKPSKRIEAISPEQAQIKLKDIPFRFKAFKLFRYLKIQTVGELLKYKSHELAEVRNIGMQTARDIRRELSLIGIKMD